MWLSSVAMERRGGVTYDVAVLCYYGKMWLCSRSVHFPDHNLTEANNFCRNPTGRLPVPWCYIEDTYLDRDTCSVPACGESLTMEMVVVVIMMMMMMMKELR